MHNVGLTVSTYSYNINLVV